jgi:hydroxymethylglutaryl-CoA lyase
MEDSISKDRQSTKELPVFIPPGGGVKLIECPRDAMQGWKQLIPTNKKIAYINALLKVGFDTIDFGSFVSPKAIPQMADTSEVIGNLELGSTNSKLLSIVANERGATDAVVYDEISCLGFPFSVSETFQKRNANSTVLQSLERVEEIQNLCIKNRKELVVYLSMGFGNPYGDVYNEEIVFEWADKLASLDIGIISIADTVGLASPEQVSRVTGYLVKALPEMQIGVHLHSAAAGWKEKADAALEAGCLRFDGALKGIGGCPMAGDELVGNMDTELMIPYFEQLHLLEGINKESLARCSSMAAEIFI